MWLEATDGTLSFFNVARDSEDAFFRGWLHPSLGTYGGHLLQDNEGRWYIDNPNEMTRTVDEIQATTLEEAQAVALAIWRMS